MKNINKKNMFNFGFTIVELLVVVVIIGVLSALSIVSYAGVRDRATASALQSDLNNASDLLRVYQAHSTSSSFPVNLNDANSGVAMPASKNTSYSYQINGATPKVFCLTATNSGKSYNINQEGIPSAGPCPMLHFDAGIATSYSGSGTSITDLGGGANNGNLVNAVTYSPNINGGILSFNGVNNRVETVSTQTYGNNMTWSAWVNCAQNINSINMFMGRHLPYFGMYDANSMFFSNNIGGTQRSVRSSTDLLLNTWYYAVFTTKYDGVNTTMSIYVNGVFKTSGVWAGAQSGSSTKFAIGDVHPDAPWYPFKGMISDVRVYNQTLTTDEINQNFNTTRSRYGR